MRRWLVLVVLAGCGSSTPSPPAPADAAPVAPRDPVPADAAAPFVLPKIGAPLACTSREEGKGGAIEILIDPNSLTGTVQRFTAGPAPFRDLRVVAKTAGNTTVLVFAGYARDDSTTLRGVARPRPPGERLRAGKSVVARLVNVGSETKLFLDGEVDFHTGARPIVRDDGSSPCFVREG